MRALATLIAVAAASAPSFAVAQSAVARSRHNLSATGPGDIKSTTETQICVFCHIGHGSRGLGANRPDLTVAHTPYSSTTLTAPVGAPTGATRICLSCHDGTIAVGMTVASGVIPVANTDGAGMLPATRRSNLGSDLRRTHPVSFSPRASGAVREPPAFDPVRLDHTGQLQCTSCHDPHREDADPVERKFLVKPVRGGALCTTCHTLPYWTANPSAHQASSATIGASSIAGLPYGTVAENGCESCHVQHHADPGGRLRRPTTDGSHQRACLACHDRSVARLDLTRDLAKQRSHAEPPGAMHDAGESPQSSVASLPETSPTAPRHVTCVDCHDPHAARKQSVAAPRADGTLAGTWGIDRAGRKVMPAQYQYEICFKCHADSANQPGANGLPTPDLPRRTIVEVNLRRVFDVTSPSFHPIEGPGRGADVPSLIPPLSPASVIYCTDCHASDEGPGAGGSGPAGPHGSIYPFLLERRYATADHTIESASAYALCYKCHDRAKLLSPESAPESAFAFHARHVSTAAAPCSACHNAHGVSAAVGDATHNAHLIDFDRSIVQPGTLSVPSYSTEAPRAGSCNLTCHGELHADRAYPLTAGLSLRSTTGSARGSLRAPGPPRSGKNPPRHKP